MDGRKKLGDFGLVTQMTENELFPGLDELSYAEHTAHVGTHLYMSPEQMRGLQQYDNKVDIYALGLILFELKMEFETKMERTINIEQLRLNKFPLGFEEKFPDEVSADVFTY